MTPLEILQSFIDTLQGIRTWELVREGSSYYLVAIDRQGTRSRQGFMQTYQEGFPAQVVFDDPGVPTVVARTAEDLQCGLEGLRQLSTFQQLIL